VIAALHRFLASREPDKGRSFVRGVILHKLYGPKRKGIDTVLVDDLVQAAIARAMGAQTPPLWERGIPGWVARVTKCAIVHYFRSTEADAENLDRGADAYDWSDRHAPATDWGAREHLICKYLEPLVGDDPNRRRTFQAMMETRVQGRSLDEVAAEQGTSPEALKKRIQRLADELGPKVSIMDREKPRRAILAVLFFLGLAALVLLVAALLGAFRPAPPPALPLAPQLAPSASAPSVPAPPPPLDNAFPTQPAPADAGDEPERVKP
jgi:DNA-directed RNA polymerase specialized sigma24 family protein